MVSKGRKIRKQKDFERIYNSKKVLSNQEMRLHFDFPPEDSPSRFAVVTSKKVGKAFVRNKLRRQIFHLLKLHQVYQTNIELVIVMKPKSAGLDFEQLQAKLFELLDKIRY